MALATPLRDLVSERGALYRAYHEHAPVVLKKAVSVEGLPTSTEIDAMIDASLLKWPYFAVFKDGVRAPLAEVTQSRQVLGKDISGFVRPEGVRQHIAAGATFKLNQLEDFHGFMRAQAGELARVFPSEVSSYMFLTPGGKRGMVPHRDPSRVIVVQIEGSKEWHLYHSDEAETPDSGTDVDPATKVAGFVLEPGDVLYLPHAYGHACDALDQPSLHLTFSLAEPGPAELMEAYVQDWLSSDGMSALNGTAVSSADAVAALVADLRRYLGEADPRRIIARALESASRKEI